MKKIYLQLLLLVCGIILAQAPAFAQCPIVYTSTVTASNDTTLPCGGTACATINVLSSSTTLTGTNAYSVSSIAYAPNPLTGTALPALSDDIFSGVIGIPFPFCFFGTKYTSCVIGTNANISFNTTLAGAGDPWQITGPLPGGVVAASSRNAIMFPYMDFLMSSGGAIRYATYGTAPCRRWVVSFDNVAFFQCTTTKATVQVVLYETTNVIEMFFQSKPICSGWNSGFAVTAIENATGTVFYAAPGQNGTAFTATNQGWRFTPNSPPTWNYTWYSSLSPLTPIAYTPTAVVCPTVTHTYYLKGVATSNCDSVVVWDSVKVTTAPPAGAILGVAAVCQGSSATLTDTSAGTWSSGNPGVATITPGGVWTGVSPGTAVISYSAATGCVQTRIVTVNILAPITGVTTVCLGNSSLLSNIAGGGTWTSSDPSVATVAAGGLVSSAAPGTTIISYTTPAGCLSTIPFVVNPNPVAIINPGVVCQGLTIGLSDATPGGTWASSNTTVATINPANGILTGVSAGTVTITYRLPTTCFVTSPVTVNPLPGPIGGLNRVCATFDITLTDAAAGGTWTSSNPAVATINSATGILHGVMAGAVVVTYTLPTGCLITTPVTVYALPAPPVTADLIYCQRTSGIYPPLTAVTAAGGTLNWYSTATSSGTIPTPTPVTTPGVYTWYVSQTVNQCESPSRAPLTVTVHAQSPRPDIVAWKPYACQYDTIGLHYGAAPYPGIQYTWAIPSYAAIKGGTKTTPDLILQFDTAYIHNWVSLTTSDGYVPCAITDSIDVPVKIAPVAQSYSKHDICVGDTATIALSFINGAVVDYYWDFGTDASMVTANSNHGGPFHLSWGTPGIHVIKLSASNGFACPLGIFKDTINVHDAPDPTIGSIRSVNNPTDICLGDSVEFSAKVYNGENSYTWSPAQFFNQNNKWSIFGRINAPVHVMLTVTDPFGCSASDSTYINAKSCCTVGIPTAFSPNGDGRNNVFRPITGGHHRIHSFRVVNRWGQVMFEGANENCAWDGNFNGVPQDIGVYFWFIRYDCDGRTIDDKGDVTLIR